MYDFSTFDNFIASTDGQTVGAGECWDYIEILWEYLGGRYYTYPPSDPTSTNHGVKWGWISTEARAANTITHLTQVVNLSEIKKGDIVIVSDGEFGHAGYAAEDYDGSGYLYEYSQNYAGRRSVAMDHASMANFLGAWRYDAWETPPTEEETKFPWVLYARKLREKRSQA